MESRDIHLRRRVGIPQTKIAASVAPPPLSQRNVTAGRRKAVAPAAVVFIVRVAVMLPPDAKVTLAGLMEQVGRL